MFRHSTADASRVRHRCCVRLGAAAAIAFTTLPPIHAQDTTRTAGDTSKLAAVTVIGSRSDIDEVRQRVLTMPGGAALIPATELRATRQANLHDVLRFTPGVYVQPRFGAADESQISVRGSGLRNNFHARGINLLVNGMPYRSADGFTDFESLELLTTEAVEVHRGANALRYGGSTLGGAVNLLTHTGHTALPFMTYVQGGAHGFVKGQIASGGMSGRLDWYGSLAHTQLTGYRDWSDQRRDRVNLHAGYVLTPATDVRAFYFGARVREHLPGSLSRAELAADPSQAFATNRASRWGRDYDLHHVGFQYRTQLSPTQRLEISPYLQYRDIDHPIFEVIAQITQDWGAELRYENTARLFGLTNRLTVGVQPALGNVQDKQFQNAGGEHGNLTRDERDRATSLALYVENALNVGARVTATLGGRLERSTRRVDDRFLSNGDQSDERDFDAFSPRAGVIVRLTRATQLFANASRTVEPPLLLELSSFGNSGGFIPLAMQSAWQYEVGSRTRALGVEWDLSLYDIELRDELLNLNVQPFPGAPFTVPTYRNAPRTRHAGVEVGGAFMKWVGLLSRGDLRDAVGARLAYTYNRFTFEEDPMHAGNDLPGAPRHYLSAELRYEHPAGIRILPNVEWVPVSYFVNSANTDRNDAWSNVGVRAEWSLERAGAVLFLSAQNLANRRYSGSVQVDNAAGRFFEPSDPRSLYAGMRWAR